MSAVALPHVPSARAPSSAASSTRRSVHSASSTASHVSSKSQRHGYDSGGAGDEEDEEDNGEENVSEEEEEEEEEEPHESSSGSGSGGLWDEVESFLNKPSPSFAALAKDTANNKSSSAGANVLPTLRAGDRKHPVAPPGGNQSSGPRGSRPSIRQYAKQSSSSSSKAIDPKLLQEAFAYAEKIQRVSFDDAEDDDHHQPDQQREAERRGSGGVGMLRRDTSFGSSSGAASGGPRMPHDATLSRQGSIRGAKGDDAKAKKKKTAASVKTSAYGASVKPTPSSKKKMSSGAPAERRASSSWDASPSSTADPNGDGMAQSRKGGASAMMDQQTIQSLVSSLQNGTALDELRRELAASQQSLAMSRLVIQEAAQSFFRK